MGIAPFVILVCLLYCSHVTAQLEPGARIRIQIPENSEHRITGNLVSFNKDSLEFRETETSRLVTIRRAAISKLEVSQGRHFNRTGCIEGSIIGLAIGSIVLGPSIMHNSHIGSASLFAGSTTIIGGAMGLGGKNSKRGALYGLAAGMFIGFASGTVVEKYHPSQKAYPLAGLIGGGFTGMLTGITIGIIKPEEKWHKISVDEFGHNFVPSKSKGIGLNLSCVF